jgi:hypothetical protein
MIIKENVTVYQCEHCKKKMFRKHAMERHIDFCTYNPKNFTACSGCAHLDEIKIEYSVDHYFYVEVQRKSNGFRCKKLDKTLYPLKAKRLGLPEKYPETFEDQELMPRECEFAEYHGLMNFEL